ncbi:MAG: hypothetical protein H6Q18_55 [Bacteroidetes bacterium]|nr:hypothetical protein [Bacteroidota bacterium]
MKKTVFIFFSVLLLCSCESKYEKGINDLKSQLWVLTSITDYSDKNITKEIDITKKTISKYTDNLIYVYNYKGELQNIYNYKTEYQNGKIIIIIENSFSYKQEKYTVIVNKSILNFIGGENSLQQTVYYPLRDQKILNKISEIKK